MIYDDFASFLTSFLERATDLARSHDLNDGVSGPNQRAQGLVLWNREGTCYELRLLLKETSATEGLALLAGFLILPTGEGVSQTVTEFTHRQQIEDRSLVVKELQDEAPNPELFYQQLGYPDESCFFPALLNLFEPCAFRHEGRVYHWEGFAPDWGDLNAHEHFLYEMGGVRMTEDVLDLGLFQEYAFRVYHFEHEDYEFYFAPCARKGIAPLFLNIESFPSMISARERLQRYRKAVDAYELLSRTINTQGSAS